MFCSETSSLVSLKECFLRLFSARDDVLSHALDTSPPETRPHRFHWCDAVTPGEKPQTGQKLGRNIRNIPAFLIVPQESRVRIDWSWLIDAAGNASSKLFLRIYDIVGICGLFLNPSPPSLCSFFSCQFMKGKVCRGTATCPKRLPRP